MSTPLPPFIDRDEVQRRLQCIFLEGSHARNYCTRQLAASTVFTMLYVGAVEGSARWAAPKHIYRMSHEQAARRTDAARIEYAGQAMKQGSVGLGKQWYADTTREPIRDETLRQGFIAVGAAHENKAISSTSSKPRYALAKDFAELFNPTLPQDELEIAIEAWRKSRLSKAALARIQLVRAGTKSTAEGVLVEFPGGEGRSLSPGESSYIAKAVIEEFATRFLKNPLVLWLSESGNKVVARDEVLAARIGLKIDAARVLPDIILADVGHNEVLIVFTEVVATDGPINEVRREELLKIAKESGLENHVTFVTAFMDRNHRALRKALDSLAWNSFVWVASEPDKVIALIGPGSAGPTSLHTLLSALRGTGENT